MQPYPWALVDPRKRPKRVAKKINARWGWRRCLPKCIRDVPKIFTRTIELSYVPTRKGARPGNIYEAELTFRSDRRVVGMDYVGSIMVSTIFICIDHSMGSDGDPILWDTMLFDGCVPNSDCEETLCAMGLGPEDLDYLEVGTWRYRSRADAASHHRKIVAMLRKVVPCRESGFNPSPG